MFRNTYFVRIGLPLLFFSVSACGDPANPRNGRGAGPARVDIGALHDPGAPASHAILAKAGISNVTGTTISGGSVGVSPAAASFVTGFALVADPSATFWTSRSVAGPGRVYAASNAAPTPRTLELAVSGMEAAYTDASLRSPPDVLNVGAGNLGGLTLAPGLYRWGTSVSIPADVTLVGGADDIWIFQIAGDLDLATGTRVRLSGGADADHVFWQVAGGVVLHVNSRFSGIILCKTAITLATNAAMTGRALALTMVALDDNVISVE